MVELYYLLMKSLVVLVKQMVPWMQAKHVKPMLAQERLHCIGATTLNEYREYIEKIRH